MEVANNQVRNSLFSCTYVFLTLLFLKNAGWLYQLGQPHTFLIPGMLILFDYAKAYKEHRIKRPHIKKAAGIISASTLAYAGIAVLFGAPFLSEHRETGIFACFVAALTSVHALIHLGVKGTVAVFGELGNLDFYGGTVEDAVLRNIQGTLFGAWCSAVVIPLDWNRPWQAWPIPCTVGALLGFFVGNLASLVIALLCRTKRNYKRTRCV